MSGVVTVSRALTPRNWTSASDPTNGWDAADGVRVGDYWYNTASGNVFVCVTNTVGAAVWRHVPRILGSGGAVSSITGTTTETALATVVVPAACMGAGGHIRVTAAFSYTNSANNKTVRIRFGASGAGTGGTNYHGTTVTTTQSIRVLATVHNRNSVSSQAGSGGTNASTTGWTATAQAVVTSAVDTSAAAEIVFTGTLANTGETITLENYTVELIRPDIT